MPIQSPGITAAQVNQLGDAYLLTEQEVNHVLGSGGSFWDTLAATYATGIDLYQGVTSGEVILLPVAFPPIAEITHVWFAGDWSVSDAVTRQVQFFRYQTGTSNPMNGQGPINISNVQTIVGTPALNVVTLAQPMSVDFITGYVGIGFTDSGNENDQFTVMGRTIDMPVNLQRLALQNLPHIWHTNGSWGSGDMPTEFGSGDTLSLVSVLPAARVVTIGDGYGGTIPNPANVSARVGEPGKPTQ